MAQRNIDFGTFPNDPDADAIRTAFQKTQENFTELFAGLQDQAVLSVNKTPGAGITVFPITGNVVVSADIACVRISTTTLSVGINGNGSSTATMDNSQTQILYIDLPANITGVSNATFSGTVTSNTIAANLAITSSNTITATGNITGGNISTAGALTVTGNANVGNIGASNGVFTANVTASNIYANSGTIGATTGNFSGNISSNNANFTNNVNANIITAAFFSGDGSNLTNVTSAPGNIIQNADSNVSIPTANSSVRISVAGTANVMVISQTGANVTGTLGVSGNANAGNIGAAAGVFTSNVTAGNVYANSGTVGASLLTGTLTTAAQPNITSVGTLTSLTVSGNITGGNLLGPLANGNSNVRIATSNGNVTITAVGNTTMTVSGTGANITGTANVSGNANVGNIGATAGVFTGNVTAGNANVTGQLISTVSTGTAPLVVTSTTVVANLRAATANAATNAEAVQTNASTATTAYPTFVTASTNANYALNTVSGISANLSNNSITATTFVGSLSGAATSATSATNAAALLQNTSTATTVYPTFTTSGANGNSSAVINTGISANLSNASITATTFVGALSGAATTAGTVTTAAQPNITSVGTLSSLSVTGNVTAANFIGNLANGNSDVNIPAANGNINFDVAGNANVVVVTGTGINVAGTLNVTGNANVGNLGATGVTATTLAGSLTTASQPNITSVGTLGSLTVTNKVTAGQLQGDGGNISNIQGGNVSGAVATATAATNASALLQNTSTATSVYPTFTTSSANGNSSAVINTGITANLANASITATTFVGALSGAATTAGTVTTAAQPNITSVGTLTSLAVTGNVTAANFLGNLANGNSDINIPAANGNINFDVAGNANIVVITGTGANITGTLNASGNANVGNLGTAGLITATGNVSGGNLTTAGVVAATGNVSGGNLTTAGVLSVTGNANVGNLGTGRVIATGNISGTQLISNIATGTAPLVVTSTTQVANLNAATAGAATNAAAVLSNTSTNTTVYLAGTSTSGNANVALEKVAGIYANMANNAITATTFVGALSGAATTAGTVTTAAQPNITSVGTLSSLSVTGNISSGNANLGNLVTANFFSGDGSLLTNVSVGAGSYIQNGNSEVRVDANSNVRVNVAGTSNVLVVTSTGANVTGTANISGNLSAGNVSATLLTGTLATASQPNVTSLGTLTGLDINGIANLGAVGNVRISGGSNNQVLVATGTGSNVAFVTATSLTIAPGLNTQVLFNDAGSFAANANMTFDKTTGTLSSQALAVTTNITAGNVFANSGTVRGSLLTGTLTTAAQPNITSVGSLTSLIVSGNLNAGNVAGGNLVTANFITGTLTTAAQPNITSIGTLTGLGVNGNITAANITANTGVFTGNGAGLTNLAGANVTGTVANATFATSAGSATTAGTVTTAAQPNITSVGTLTGLTVNGLVSASRSTINYGVATSNIHALTVLQTWNNSSVQFSAIEANITDTNSAANSLLLDLQISNVSKFAVSKEGNVFFSGTVTGNGAGLSAIAGANVTGTVSSATTAGTVTTAAQPNITSVGTLTSAAVTGNVTAGNVYANSGTVGASLLAGTLTTAAQPNITSVGTLTSLTTSGNATAGNVNTTGTLVLGGNISNADIKLRLAVNSNNAFIQVGNGTAGSTGNIIFSPYTNSTAKVLINTDSGNLTAGNINGGNAVAANFFIGSGNNLSNIQGSNVTGAVATATSATTAGTVTTAAQPNITSVGTLTSLGVTGTATAGNLSTGGNLSVSGNAVISGNLTVDGNLVYVNVETLDVEDPIIELNSGPNGAAPTSNSGKDVGTALNYYDTQARLAFMGWDVSNIEFGLASQASITNEVVTFTTYGNLRVGNIIGNGQALTALTGANVTGQVGNALVAGTVYTAAQPNITSVGTLTSLSMADANTSFTAGATNGNIRVDNLVGSRTKTIFSDAFGQVAIGGSGNVIEFYTGSALAVANIKAVINADGNLGLGFGSPSQKLMINGNANANGTITGTQLISNIATGTAPLVVTSTTQVANLNVATAGSATTAGTVTTAAQPNITSVGTLTSLAVTGNVTAGNFVGRLANGNSNVNIATANGNVTIAAVGNSIVTVTGTGVNIAGTLNATGAGTIGGDLGVSGNAVITGNLAVNGNLSYLNVETVAVEDPIINLQTGANGAAPTSNSGKDVGSALNYYDTQARIAFMGWDVSNTEFGLASQASITNEVVTFTTYGNLRVGNIIGNGQALTAINGSNVTGQVGNALVAGTVYTNAQPNITSVTSSGGGFTVGNTSNGGVYFDRTTTAFNSYTGATEGAQLSLAWTGVSGITGQANGTWNMDVDNSNNYRLFYQNASGATGVSLTAYSANSNVQMNANLITSGYMIRSVGTGISAAGTNQGTATAITKEMNVVSTVASGAGIILPTAAAGMAITIINTSANALLVYPHSGGDINGAAINAAYSQPAGATLQYVAPTTTDWYTVGATFA